MKKQLLLILLMVISPFAAFADEWTDPETNVIYLFEKGGSVASIKQGTPELAGCPNVKSSITIKSKIFISNKEYKVTLIRPYAFNNCSQLKSVIIENGISVIGNNVFGGCNNLNDIIIPESVEKIGSSCFYGCESLEEVELPESIMEINELAFKRCSNLKTINLPSGLTTISRQLFYEDGNLSSITIPRDVTKIEESAFYFTSLESVTSLIQNPFNIPYYKSSDYWKSAFPLCDTLYVPLGTKQKYLSFTGWEKCFQNIVEIDLGGAFTLNVIDDKGVNVNSHVEVKWYNKNGKQIATGHTIGGVKQGEELYYQICLDESFSRVFRESPKQKVTVKGTSTTCQLVRIEELFIHGKVQAYGTALYRAEINLTQWLNGKYEYTASALTDANGEFTLSAYNDSMELIVTANGYIDNKIIRRNLNNGGELGCIEMVEVQGKVVALNLSYQEATREGMEPNVQNWYSDTRNIEYIVHNITKGHVIEDFAIQQGNIVMPTGTDCGDKIQVTARSLNEKFTEATAEGIIADNDTANVSISLLAFGGIEATYGQKSDDNLLAMLYDSSGKLQMRTVCASSRLTFTNLAAGTYSLVTMGYNGAIGSVADISDLANMDLAEGQDYVRSTTNVRDGYISSINVVSVPELDASKFEYTGINTSYMPNKTQLVVGNFITLTARLDFKEQYSGKTDNAKIVVEIPEGCEFVPNSVVIGAKPIPHSINGEKLTISVDKEDLDRRIRFCVIPTETGTYMTTAYAEFDYKGTKTQPMGQIKFESTSGDYYVPSTTRTPTIMVGGIGVPKADVEVYDGESLIGTTRSLANGKWSLNCELNNAYNLSTHSIYVKYRGEGNVVGKTDAKDCFYDINAIVVQSVEMLNTAHPAGNLTPTQYSSVWDFHALTSSKDYYLYWPEYPDFTFLVNLSENDTTKVSDVVLSVYTMDGDVRRLPATYDGKHGCFVATSSFDSYSAPVNVSVEFISLTKRLADRKTFEDLDIYFEKQTQLMSGTTDSLNVIENINKAIDNQTNIIISAYQQVLSDGVDGLSANELSTYLNTLGIETSTNELMPLVPTLSDDERKNYIDNLLKSSDALLESTSTDKYDNSDDSDIVILSNSLLEHIDSLVNINESLESLKKDTLYFDLDNESWMYFETPYNSISIESLNPSDAINLDLTDDSQILLFTNGNQYVIVDSTKQKAWIISNCSSQPSLARVRRAGSADSAIERLKRFVTDAPARINDMTNTLKLAIGNFQEQIRIIDDLIDTYQREIGKCGAEYARLGNELKEIQRELWRLDNITSVEDTYRPNELWNRRIALENRQKELLEKINYRKSRIDYWTKEKNKAGAKRLPLLGFVSTLSDLVNTVQGAWQTVNAAQAGIQDWNNWNNFINNGIFPCENDQSGAKAIRDEAIRNRNSIAWQYGGSIGLAAAGTGVSGTMLYLGVTNKAASFVVDALADWVSRWLRNMSSNVLNSTYQKSVSLRSQLINKRAKLKCKKKDDDDDDDDDKRKNKDPKTKEDDPSGFVYEAVPTNRVEGVKATIYYAEDGEVDYPVQWDAAEFGQINPQITDESGLYAWDVPQGFWKVIFEKEGYETTETDWLPVPPPQLDVNIPMSQAVAPYVEDAKGMESGITLSFSKYMKPNTLTKSNRVSVTCNGKNVSGDVELLNLEENPFNKEEYVSKIKFVPNKAFTTSDEVIITVKKEVESYANKQMTKDFVQRVKIESEINEIACDSVMAVDYHGTGVLELSVLPAAAAKGRTIQIASTSSMIASTDAQSVTLNDEGKARIIVSGELPGCTSLHLSMPDAGKEKYVTVSVVTKEEQVVKTPKASKLSGSTMEDSYMLSLTCATKGATIYYTIDGSCPCDEQTRKKYTGPITLPEGQIILQAVAVREGMVDSDVAEFTYTVVKDEANGIRVIEESHDFEASYQDGSIVISGAKGASCHIYDLQGRELASRNRISNQTRIIVPKTDVYIVSVLFSDEQTVVHKIMAK